MKMIQLELFSDTKQIKKPVLRILDGKFATKKQVEAEIKRLETLKRYNRVMYAEKENEANRRKIEALIALNRILIKNQNNIHQIKNIMYTTQFNTAKNVIIHTIGTHFKVSADLQNLVITVEKNGEVIEKYKISARYTLIEYEAFLSQVIDSEKKLQEYEKYKSLTTDKIIK